MNAWATGTGLELARPLALLLLPAAVLVWLWWSRRPVPHRVATTFIWRRVPSTSQGALRGGAQLLFLLLLAAALCLPRWHPPPGARDLPSLNVFPAASGALRAEVLLPPGDGNVNLELSLGDRPWVSESVSLRSEAPTGWTARLPEDALPGDLVRVSVGADRLSRRVPPLPAVPTIENRSDGRAVEEALLALDADGRVRVVDRDGDLLIARAATYPPDRPGIALPNRESRELLPIPEAVVPPAPLLEGLDPERWTIPHRYALDETWTDAETLLGSSAGPLIVRRGACIALAFEPDEIDIAYTEKPYWPVLLGRMVEDLAAPVGPEPRVRLPADSPRQLLLVVALLLVPLLGVNGVVRGGLSIGVLAAVLVPAWELGGPPARVRVEPDSREASGPRAEILAAARRLPWGGRVEIPRTLAPPLHPGELLDVLRRRGIALELATDRGDVPEISVSPTRVEVGAPVDVRVRNDRLSIRIVGPSGRTETLEATGGVARFSPDEPGWWSFESSAPSTGIGAAIGAVVEVVGRVPALRLEGSETSGAAGLLADDVFDPRPWRAGTSALSEALPDRPEDAVVVWDGLDPGELTPADRGALQDWIVAGGTVFVPAAPPFLPESLGKDWLSDRLPAPLPPEQREPITRLGIVLMDLSGSMRQGGWEAMVEGVQALLRGSPQGSSWGVCGFDEGAGWIARPGRPVDAALVGAIAATSAGGGTRLDRALEFVLDAFPPERPDPNLVILTDGRTVPSPALDSYATELAARGVSVTVVGAGPDVNAPLLERFARAADGRWYRAPTPADARRILAEAVRGTPDVWRGTASPVRPVGANPLIARLGAELPKPRRHIDVSPGEESEILIVDGSGAPLLVARPLGRGRTLLWAGGLDPETLGAGPAGRRIAAALSTVLVSAARGTANFRRRLERRVDAQGNTWLAIERTEGGPPVERILLRELSARADVDALRETREHWGIAADARFHVLRLDAPTDAAWEIELADGSRRALPAGPPRGDFRRLVRRTRHFGPDARPWALDGVLLSAAATLALVTGRRGTRRQRSPGSTSG